MIDEACAPRVRRVRDLSPSSRRSVWQGFVGSVLVMLGGFGVGWVTFGSAFMRSPILAIIRTTPALSVLSTVVLVIGGLLMVRAWLRLGQKIGDFRTIDPRVITRICVLWSIPLLFTLPLFSRDIYAYVGQGRLMVAGQDPYTDGISSLGNYFQLGTDPMWAEAPTPYGPLFLWIEQGIVFLSGGNFSTSGSLDLAVILFRLVSAAGVVMCAYYLGKIANHFSRSASRALWLAIANPLFILNFVASGHNDGLMLGFALAAIYYTLTRKEVLGVVLLTLSVAIKPITLISLPFLGMIWASNIVRGRSANSEAMGPATPSDDESSSVPTARIWRYRVLCWLASSVITFALLALMGWANGFWFGWIKGLQAPGAVWIWFAPVGLLAQGLGAFVGLFSDVGGTVTSIIGTLFKVAGAAAVAYLIFTKRPMTTLTRMAWAYAAVVLTSSIIQPWYVIWLMMFFVAAGMTLSWHAKVVYLLTVFFTVIALTDQLNVFQSVPEWIVRTVAIVCSVLFSLYIMFWDRKTRVLFDWHFRLRQRWTKKFRRVEQAGS